jgi:type VI secretion system (T6SS) baseplate-like injector VgrG
MSGYVSEAPRPGREPSERRQYWGKYRGTVIENDDPLAMGRLLVEAPQVPAVAENWAMPCVPYAGFQVGFFAMPEIGANVWVEFEGGNPSFPIWTGCFWAEGHAPLPFAEDPLCKGFKTRSNMLLLDDTPGTGGVMLTSTPPAVDDDITLKFSAEGVLLTAPPAVLNMSIEEGITLEFPPCVLSMSEEEFSSVIAETAVVMTEEATAITSPDVSVEAEAAVEVNAAAGIDLGAGAGIAMEAGAGIDLTAGAGIAQEAGGGIDLTAGGGIAQEAGVGIDLTAGVGIAMEAATMAFETVAMDVTAPLALWAGDLNVVGIITMDTMPVMVIPV